MEEKKVYLQGSVKDVLAAFVAVKESLTKQGYVVGEVSFDVYEQISSPTVTFHASAVKKIMK